MTTFELDRREPKSAAVRPAAGWFAAALAAARRWHERRRTLAQLSELDDYLLRDLGIDPEDLRQARAGKPVVIFGEKF